MSDKLILSTLFSDGTHPVQWFCTVVIFAADMALLVVLNRRKRKQHDDPAEAGKKDSLRSSCASTPTCHDVSWQARARAFGLLILSMFALAVGLDLFFPVGQRFVGVKAYVFAFPLGLLDLHFSNTRGFNSSFKIVLGAALWCTATTQVPPMLLDNYFSSDVRLIKVVNLKEFAGSRVASWPGTVQTAVQILAVITRELWRYMTYLLGVGLAGDLIFSPMHRLQHALPGWLYKLNHKVHHEFTNKLTALVLYHGALLDDFLMPLSAGLGLVMYSLLVHNVASPISAETGWQSEAVSAWGLYLIVFNTLLSHAHDTRAANLLAPGLPPSLNFAAYHYVHHLSPGSNFGLVRFSDVFWDWVLGVHTIRDLHEFLPGGNRAACSDVVNEEERQPKGSRGIKVE